MSVIIKSMINRYLLSMLGRAELVDDWWIRPNKNWDNKTPNDIYYSGSEGREEVYRYVLSCAEGQW